jgi:integrase/recombinase XerD
MNHVITFKEFLVRQGHTKQSVKTYDYTVSVFLQKHPNANKYQYKDIVEYFGESKTHTSYRNTLLAAIKRYYDYLIEIEVRTDHPCIRLFLKGNKRLKQVITHDLFTGAELELLMNRTERYKDLKFKNQVIVSLLIYQGLTSGEIVNLKTTNIDLDNGTLFIQGSSKLSTRTLQLQLNQYRLFETYLNVTRGNLQRGKTSNSTLLLGKLGTPITVDDINYLIETFKPIFPDRNLNTKTIRQSVIANWINEKKIPLEQVQLLAGHKWISSTTPYKQTSIDEQRELVNRFHPLG